MNFQYEMVLHLIILNWNFCSYLVVAAVGRSSQDGASGPAPSGQVAVAYEHLLGPGRPAPSG